jgi:hypothetical protein
MLSNLYVEHVFLQRECAISCFSRVCALRLAANQIRDEAAQYIATALSNNWTLNALRCIVFACMYDFVLMLACTVCTIDEHVCTMSHGVREVTSVCGNNAL